jgi:anti-sigma factor RsiW
MDARVEAYIDDCLPPGEQTRFEARLWADPYWEKQVERARSIRSALQSQSSPSPPTDLTDAILRRASSAPSAQPKA